MCPQGRTGPGSAPRSSPSKSAATAATAAWTDPRGLVRSGSTRGTTAATDGSAKCARALSSRPGSGWAPGESKARTSVSAAVRAAARDTAPSTSTVVNEGGTVGYGVGGWGCAIPAAIRSAASPRPAAPVEGCVAEPADDLSCLCGGQGTCAWGLPPMTRRPSSTRRVERSVRIAWPGGGVRANMFLPCRSAVCLVEGLRWA